MWSSNSQLGNNRTFQNCRCIRCRGTDTQYAEGGGISVYLNTYNVGISNTLFTECYNEYGGAVWMSFPSSDPSDTLCFCFFNQNTGIHGNDIYFKVQPSNSPLLHCLSTSAPRRIYNGNDNWITLTNILGEIKERGVKVN